MISIFSMNLDPSAIAQYLDYGLYAILGLVGLGFIFGFFRGVWREGFRLIVIGLLSFVAIFLTRDLIDFAVDFDLAPLLSGIGFTEIALPLGTPPVIVPITNLYDTIELLLEQSLLSFGFSITPQITEIIIGLTLVIIRYLVFIVLAVFILLFGEFIAAILYFFPFRFIIPRLVRKKTKLRLLGGVSGALKMTIVLAMFLSPFTSLVNAMTGAFKRFDEQFGNQINSALYDQLMGYVNAYENSAFANVLFSWYQDENGATFDTALMDFVTGEDLDDYRLTLANEIESLTNIAATVVSTGFADTGLQTLDTSLLISESFVTNLITSLTGSTLVMRIIPIVVEIALNFDEVAAFVDPSLIDFESIDWETELVNVGGILSGVIRSGVIGPILEGDLDVETIVNSLFSEQAGPEIASVLRLIDDSEFLGQVVPAVLYGLVSDELDAGLAEGTIGLSTFLPTTWVEYDDVNFGEELAIIYELVYELVNEADGFLDLLFNSLAPQSSLFDPLAYRRYVDETPTISSFLQSNFDLIVEILLGEVSEDGLPINNDPVSGKALNRGSLFDSDIVMRGIPGVVEAFVLPTLTSVAGENFDDTELQATITGFNTGSLGQIRQAYKGEIAGLLSVVNAILNNDQLANLLEPNAEPVDLLDLLEEDSFRNDLKSNVVPKLDRSEIIFAIIPAFLETTLTGPEFADFLSLIGLTADDLNFEFESVSRELNLVIDMLGYATSVLSAASGDLIAEFPNIYLNLVGLLDTIYFSDIINLNPITNSKSTNYRSIIKGIFSLVEGFGINDDDIDFGFNQVTASGSYNGWTTVYTDTNDNDFLDSEDIIDPLLSGENFHLVNFLNAALSSGILDLSGDLFDGLNDLASGSEDLDDPNVSPLYKVFAFADRSNIIAASFGGILDDLFGATGGLLDSEIGSSFRNVVSWTEEGSTLIYLVKQLVNFQDGLENLNFLEADIILVEELLQGLAASQIFINSDGDYVFPDFLLNQLKGIGDLSDYFQDPSPYLSEFDNDASDDFTIVTSDFYAIGNTSATRDNWFGEKELIVDGSNEPILNENGDLQYQFVGGEIEYIVGFIGELQLVDLADLTGGTSISGDTIRSLLLALNDASSLRVLLFNIFDSIFGSSSFDIGELSLSDTNVYAFLTLNQAGRADEIEATALLLETIEDMGLSGGGAFDIANFNEDTIATVGDLLTILHDARLFNSYRLENSRENDDLTVFEQTYKFLLTTSTIDSFIYDDSLTPEQRGQALTQDLLALDNNFAENEVDSWNGEEGEIQKFVDVMLAFVRTGIDFNNFNGDFIAGLLDTLEGLGKVEDLLLSMNDSIVIAPSIGNLFGNIFSSPSFNINGLNMAEANTEFFNAEPSKVERGEEISLILDIYWDIQTIGLSGGGAFTNELINPPLFDGLLSKMHDSKVFNTFKDSYGYAFNDLTIFEQTIRMILNTSTLDTFIYPDQPTTEDRLAVLQTDIAAIENNFTNEALLDGWIGETGEIARIINILESFKDTDINFDGFDSSAMSNLLSGEGGVAKIENLLLAINESVLVFPALPNLFDDIFGTPAFNLDGVNIAEANTGFFRTENDVESRGTEISLLMDIYEHINNLGLNSGALTAASIDEEVIDSMLRDLHRSKVFNTFKDSFGYAFNDLTVFEQTVFMVLDTSQLSNYIYDGETAPEALLKIDIVAIGNNLANTVATVDGWQTLVTGEIDRIVGILSAFKGMDIDFADFAGSESSDTLSGFTESEAGIAKIENLLLSMNRSAIVYPAIPNLFSNMLGSDDVGNIGVDFSTANTKYRGNRNDPLNPLSDDKYLPYQEAEISSLLSIFQTVKDVATKSFDSLDQLENDDLDAMQFLIEDLHNSFIFHLSGAASGDEDDATVFEQMVIKMMKDTRVSDFIFDTNDPSPNYLINYVTKEEKTEFLVVNFLSLFPESNTTHFTYGWLDDENQEGELTRFFRVFKEMKNTLPAAGNLDGINPGSIAPSGIGRIMSSMAYSNLASDGVPGLLSDAFDVISFGTYTEANENYYLTPKQYFIADLNSIDYSLPTPEVTQQGVIDQALNSFYDEDAGQYITLGANFNMRDFLDTPGNSTFPLLDLLSRSEIFGNQAQLITAPTSTIPGTVAASGNYRTRALTFYNLLKQSGVTKYFDYLLTSETDKELKVERIEAIFVGDFLNFETDFEAERLDDFIGLIGLLMDQNLTDASQINNYASEMREIIELTYTATGQVVNRRAYLTSELAAGFLTDIFDEEYEEVTDPNAPYISDPNNLNLRINFYDKNNDTLNEFAYLNPREADGLEGSLNYLNALSAISEDFVDQGSNPFTFTIGATELAQLKAALVKMGSLVNTDVTGGPFGPSFTVLDYGYDDYDIEGNAAIAKLFYGARVVSSSGFNVFNNLVEAKSTQLDPSFVVTLSTTPYANLFVFEIEGEKIEYVFGQP